MAFKPTKTADVEAGIFFTLFGAVTAGMSLQYPLGTIAMMGPGMFPLMLGIILTAVGLAILASGLFTGGEQVKSLPLKATLVIAASLVAFALLALTVGLLVAIPVQVFIALWASEHFTVKRALLLSAGLLAFCYVVFVYFLGVSVPMIAV